MSRGRQTRDGATVRRVQAARREKKCRACPARFVPTRPLQVACCPDCAQTIARRNREKAEKRAATIERQKTRAALEALKTIPQLIAEADRAFCAWVRVRDAGLPCICCGETAKSSSLTGGEWDAGLNCGDPKYVFKEGAFIWADTPLQKRLIKLTLKARLNTTRFSQCHANSAP